MRELKLEEIQQASLAILDEIDRICAKQHLTYYLAYGTLIGAVRHHGFIPWDDDLDIMMPRADYEKLRRYFKKKYEGKLKLCTRADTDRYIYGIYRVVDPSYVFENTNEYELGYDGGAFIDIYPLDAFGGEGPEEEKRAAKVFRKINAMNQVYGSWMKPGAKTKIWRKPVKYLCWLYVKLFKGGKKYCRRIDRDFRDIIEEEFSPDDAYVGVVAWDDRVVRYRREWFEETARLPFAGREFSVPADWDDVLKTYYGDYMALPPEKDRHPQHDYRLYAKD